MALDLFAVLFGGAMAMLPIFASDILLVGPAVLASLRTAPSVGALLVMVIATRRPPSARAGTTLLTCVFGFGLLDRGVRALDELRAVSSWRCS